MPDHPLLDLRDVTVCAVDCVNPVAAARAIELSMSQCNFADAILFTSQAVPARARIQPISPIESLWAYSTFLLKHLADYIRTPYVLIVQWDGYVVDASQWTDAFLDYDYIGAMWEDGVIGNGGFSLRSKRLLDAMQSDRFPMTSEPIEDALICRTYRSVLETECGIRYAPAEIASRFSYERQTPMRPSFGFHGSFNMWRHTDDDALIELLLSLDEHTFPHAVELMMTYCNLRKFACVRKLFERLRRRWNAEQIMRALLKLSATPEDAQAFYDLCERA